MEHFVDDRAADAGEDARRGPHAAAGDRPLPTEPTTTSSTDHDERMEFTALVGMLE